MIGLEVGISVASVALRHEPTGYATGFRADVAAAAKRDLKAGEVLDGERGYTVYGKLLPAKHSLDIRALPLGLAHNLKLTSPVAQGQPVTFDQVIPDRSSAFQLRSEMEQMFAQPIGFH